MSIILMDRTNLNSPKFCKKEGKDMSKKSFALVLVTLAISLSLSMAVAAQEFMGTLVGTVRDANGAAVAGATVSITDVGKKIVVRTVETNSDGEFSVPN